MPISAAAKKALFAQETGEAFLILLTISHASLAHPIRVVNNHVDVTSNGSVYTGFPFEIDLPDDVPGQPPRVRLRIDNIERQIVDAVRSIVGPFSVQLDVVMGSSPSTIEASFPSLSAVRVEYDALVVEADLAFEDVLNEPFPGDSFIPSQYPGLF